MGLGILAVAVVVVALGPLRSGDGDWPQVSGFPAGTVTLQEEDRVPEGTVLLRTDAGAEIIRSGASASELVARGAVALDLSADGSGVVASIGEELVAIDLSSGQQSVLVRASGEDVLGAFALWSPDGSRVAYSVGAPDPQERSMVCVVALVSEESRCFPDVGRVYTIDWAPDSSRAGPLRECGHRRDRRCRGPGR
jgi:hypothetical protein